MFRTKKKKKMNEENNALAGEENNESLDPQNTDIPFAEPNEEGQPQVDSEMESLREELTKMQDKYLRLTAEFDNYRKRTAREKLELISTASENVMKGILPVLDDVDRAIQAVQTATDINAVKEGMGLIQNKLFNYLQSCGLSEINALGETFHTDEHDAVTRFAVQDEAQKGRVIDVAQKGYKLNDKVIRYAKVIVGE